MTQRISERASFIVDKAGRSPLPRSIPLDQLPDIEELLQALRGLGWAKEFMQDCASRINDHVWSYEEIVVLAG